MMIKKYLIVLILLFSGCSSIPDGIEPVSDFEASRYLGKWYEIARLDHSFERGLSNVTAEYSFNKDGTLRVINRGFNIRKAKWQVAEGKAKFIESSNIGRLKVSFFGPFYGGYNIIDLDKNNYQYVMIAGGNRDYLWILSRTPKLPEKTQKRLIDKAKSLNFAVDKLIFVDQSLANNKK